MRIVYAGAFLQINFNHNLPGEDERGIISTTTTTLIIIPSKPNEHKEGYLLRPGE